MKKMYFGRWMVSVICLVVFLGYGNVSHAASHAYMSGVYAGVRANYVLINMNDKSIKPVAITAGNKITATDSIANMAKSYNAFAAVNGTYFDAYGNNKYPVPYNTIIKDGKLLHMSNGHPVAGFTKEGKLIIDRISYSLKGYVNGQHRSIPWRVNHPTTEADSITVFTPEYGARVEVMAGAKAPIVQNGVVIRIATASFDLPKDAFAILYNPAVAHLATERFHVGDKASWDYEINTTFTKKEDWKNVTTAIGAGPSLIINGQITANGAQEGFTEAKINTYASSRSFIGNTAQGKVMIGNFSSATVSQAANACKAMGLVNAMCLDGGGSVALYHNGSVKTAGRNINSALGFIVVKEKTPAPVVPAKK